jgi:hypothetical protein
LYDARLALERQRVAPVAQLAFDRYGRPHAQRHACVDPYPRFTGIDQLGGEGTRSSWLLNESASATDLHLSVDEYPTPNDTDYIESGITSSTVRLRLSDILPPEFTP